MNSLLSLNKKLILFLTFILLFIFIYIFLNTFYKSNRVITQNINLNETQSDISKPKFSINSNLQNISVTAKEGNFLNVDEIMLKKNVVFQSKEFKIFTESAVFNKKTFVASSKYESKFVSGKSQIQSKGFDIIEKGNIINFKGKTKLILR